MRTRFGREPPRSFKVERAPRVDPEAQPDCVHAVPLQDGHQISRPPVEIPKDRPFIEVRDVHTAQERGLSVAPRRRSVDAASTLPAFRSHRSAVRLRARSEIEAKKKAAIQARTRMTLIANARRGTVMSDDARNDAIGRHES